MVGIHWRSRSWVASAMLPLAERSEVMVAPLMPSTVNRPISGKDRSTVPPAATTAACTLFIEPKVLSWTTHSPDMLPVCAKATAVDRGRADSVGPVWSEHPAITSPATTARHIVIRDELERMRTPPEKE